MYKKDRYKNRQNKYEFNKIRKVIINSYDVCAICKRPVDKSIKAPSPMSAEVDHIIPYSKGGSDSFANLRLTHKICNQK
jgi:5-methylcytosine-specific restriction endonuclease McrA